MKKYLMLLSGIVSSLLTTSCKKDHECECVTKMSFFGYTYKSEPMVTTIKDATRRQAKMKCVTRKVSETYDFYGDEFKFTVTQECELK